MLNSSERVIKEIHDPVTGRVDALLFADYLGLSVPEMAQILCCSAFTLRKHPMSLKSPRKQYITDLYIIVTLLKDKLGENFRMWLNAPNEQLSDEDTNHYFSIKTPIEFLRFGGENKFHKLLTVIQNEPTTKINFEWLEELREDELRDCIVELVYATNYQHSDLVNEWREMAIDNGYCETTDIFVTEGE